MISGATYSAVIERDKYLSNAQADIKICTWRATKRPRFWRVSNLFGESKVHQFNVAIRCQHEIFGLQISWNKNSISVFYVEFACGRLIASDVIRIRSKHAQESFSSTHRYRNLSAMTTQACTATVLPINYASAVQKLESFQNTADDELRRCFAKPPLVPENGPHLSAQACLQQQINELCVSVRAIKTTNKWRWHFTLWKLKKERQQREEEKEEHN